MLNYCGAQQVEFDVVKENDEKIYHEHDVGYKYIFFHKETFIELLKSFVKKEWVNLSICSIFTKEGENKKALQIAKNLLAMGMDVLKVIEVTGLTAEEVYKVKESMH